MKIQGLTEPSFDEKSCPLTIDDANNIYHFSTNDIPYRSEVSSSSAFVYGIESFKQSIKEIPFGVQANVGGLLQKAGKTMQEYFPDGVDIFNGAVNVKIGDKLVEGGKLLSRTANRNLDVMRERYKKESPRLESAQQKVAFDFGSQGANWTSMLLAGPYSPFLMAGLTMTGETQERLEKWKESHGTVEGYEERQGEDSVWNVANSFVQGTIEKYLGSWAQVKAVKKGWGYVKAIGKNAIQEGFIEEPLQDVTDFYFDKFSGLSEDETLRDRMFGSLRGYIVASIFGGAGGYSAALYHRSTGIETYKDVMKGTVPEQDLEKAATKAYEQDAKTMRDIITVELESSSSLQAKRGEVYESLYKAALEQVKAAKEQGGFPELQTEEDIANYVKGVADRFADETLAEAHRRNTVIEEVLDPSLIRYENGQLVMPMTKGATSQEGVLAQESYDVIQRINEIDQEEFAKGVPEYTAPTININGIERQTTNSNGEPIAKSQRSLEYFYNWFGDSKVVDEQGRPLIVYHGTERKFDIFKQGVAEGWGKGSYFTDNIEDAKEFGGNIYAVYLKIENPYTGDIDTLLNTKIVKEKGIDVVDESGYLVGEAIREAGFDGIVAKDSNNINGLEVVVFNPNQIKSTSNRGTYSESENIYYQGDEDKNLIVYHSISANNLSKAIDFGGFPVPSLAIVKKDQEFHFDNLPITLVGNREMIDPYYDSNEVYNRDVWSKTFPQVSYKTPSDAKIKKFKEKLNPYYKETNGENELGSFTYVASRGNPSAALSEFASSSGAILYYLRNVKKQDVDLVKKDVASDILSRAGIDEELASKIRGLDVEADREEIGKAYLEMKKREIKERFSNMEDEGKREKFTKTLLESVQENKFDKDGKLYFSVADNIVYAANNYYLAKGKTAVNNIDARHQLRELIKNDDEYMEWATNFFEKELVGDKMVEVGKKLKPFTLENVVDAMTVGRTVASQDTPLPTMGKVIASGAKKLESIRDIKEESKKLVSFEKSRENMEEVTTSLYEFLDMFAKGDNFQENMDRKEAVAIALARVVKNKNITKESLVSSLRKELPSEKVFSDAIISNGLDVARKIKELSRYYFEAKPQRAVSLQEFSGAIIPTDVSFDEVAQKVEDSGLKVVRSDNQLEAVKEFDDVLFQKGVGRERGSIQFKGDRALITLTEEANSSTLAHELAHYWLQNTFLYSKSGLATPEYKQFFNSIAKYLDITDDQETIKEWQQEKWARAAEMYAMGKAPEGMEKPLTQYQQWIRKAYGEMSEPMYIDENGEAKVPEFDFETMKMFANLAGETLTEPEFKQKQEAVRGLAKSTNQMAQAKGMKTELPTYEKRSATDMGKKADEFIQRDKQLAIDIVKGLKPEQEGLFRQDLFAALRELALNEGDSDLLNELSKSMTVEEATELGQRIQALARGRIDPVKQMVELRDERMKKNKVDKKKLKEETERAKKEITKEMAEASTPKEWADFIKSLEC